MLTRPRYGRVQLVTPVYGLPTVPLPVPPVQVAPLVTVIWTELKMLPEPTFPLAAWTVSARLLIVSVSSASSRTLRTVYEQAYGSPILTGEVQPLVNPMPCWTSTASATPAPMVVATIIAAARLTNSRFVSRTMSPFSSPADPDRTRRTGRICGCRAEAIGP